MFDLSRCSFTVFTVINWCFLLFSFFLSSWIYVFVILLAYTRTMYSNHVYVL